jgi:hypothetical protein
VACCCRSTPLERVGGGKGESTGRGERRDTPKTAELLRRDLLRPGLAVGTDGTRRFPQPTQDCRWCARRSSSAYTNDPNRRTLRAGRLGESGDSTGACAP